MLNIFLAWLSSAMAGLDFAIVCAGIVAAGPAVKGWIGADSPSHFWVIFEVPNLKINMSHQRFEKNLIKAGDRGGNHFEHTLLEVCVVSYSHPYGA